MRRSDDHPARLRARMPLGAALLALVAFLLAPSVSRGDEVPEDDEEIPAAAAAPAPSAPAEEPAPVEIAPAAEEPAPELVVPETPAAPEREGIRAGTHRVTLFGGLMLGQTGRDAGILAAPVTGQPGAINYPAETALRIELDDAPTFGVRYSYHWEPRFGIELSLSRTSSELAFEDEFDRTEAAALIATSTMSAARQDALLDRIESLSRPRDIDLTFLDVGGVWIVNPRSRWPFELEAGLGWVDSSMDGLAVFELLRTTNPVPSAPVEVVNDIPLDFDTNPAYDATRCQSDIDPCIEMTAQGGLTWHLGASLGYAFTDRVHLRLGTRFRWIEQVVDPGDTFMVTEGLAGISFLFGGR